MSNRFKLEGTGRTCWSAAGILDPAPDPPTLPMVGGVMSIHHIQPGETPPGEGSIAEAHQERADGGLWEHPRLMLVPIVIGALMVAAFFIARIAGW
ncbi:DUF6480 family protein [Streptomyces sp. NPDC096339]|uniref:DUF6480 family protein n=1 Tax=Streptomyces sp. NPDC096339 TaxID=3366086 RepID=UPI003812CD91